MERRASGMSLYGLGKPNRTTLPLSISAIASLRMFVDLCGLVCLSIFLVVLLSVSLCASVSCLDATYVSSLELRVVTLLC